jgi:hypothetical protein
MQYLHSGLEKCIEKKQFSNREKIKSIRESSFFVYCYQQ